MTTSWKTAALGGLAAGALATGSLAVAGSGSHASATETVRVAVSGGHRTDPRDNGRPVRLIAAALGVPTQVFRTAFSGVSPAPAGSEPDPAQVDRNKEALLKVLAPYGVTNQALDRVSNHYRYVASAGETWPQRSAMLRATIRGGRVVGVEVVRGGSGYTTTPRLSVPGHASVKLTATLSFGKDLATNGSVKSVALSR